MKKILSLILVAAMLMSLAVMNVSAETEIGFGEYAPKAPVISDEAWTQALDENQVDAQGIYYSLDSESKTAIVGKNTYADTASAAADLKADSIVIPETVIFGGENYTVVAVGRNAFDGTALVEVVIPCDIIGEFAFAGCTSLKYVYTNATEIKGFAFWGCTALITAQISTVDSIGGGAFWNCSNLQNPVLDASVIMEKAFAGCTGVEYFVMLGDAPSVGADAFDADAKAFINEGAAGYEDFPIETVTNATLFFDIENVYANAGDTVQINVNYAAIEAGTYNVVITLAEGLTAEKTSFEITADESLVGGTLVTIDVSVAANAEAGSYEIRGLVNDAEAFSGAVIICDHADTKTVTVKAASCTEAGVENTVCTACGEIISTAEVEAKEHSYKDFVIAPTCTEGGYTRHICECCADAYTDAETEALGHIWNEGEVIVEVNTKKDGFVKYTCLTCGTVKDVTIPKLIYGDITTDKEINLSDVTTLLQYIAKWNLSSRDYFISNADIEMRADVTADGTVNLSDVTRLLQYIAKWDVVLGPQK